MGSAGSQSMSGAMTAPGVSGSWLSCTTCPAPPPSRRTPAGVSGPWTDKLSDESSSKMRTRRGKCTRRWLSPYRCWRRWRWVRIFKESVILQLWPNFKPKPFPSGFQNYERMNLADALVPRVYTNGETIIKQGDAADGMYFVEDGNTRVVRIDGNGEEKEVTYIK